MVVSERGKWGGFIVTNLFTSQRQEPCSRFNRQAARAPSVPFGFVIFNIESPSHLVTSAVLHCLPTGQLVKREMLAEMRRGQFPIVPQRMEMNCTYVKKRDSHQRLSGKGEQGDEGMHFFFLSFSLAEAAQNLKDHVRFPLPFISWYSIKISNYSSSQCFPEPWKSWVDERNHWSRLWSSFLRYVKERPNTFYTQHIVFVLPGDIRFHLLSWKGKPYNPIIVYIACNESLFSFCCIMVTLNTVWPLHKHK